MALEGRKYPFAELALPARSRRSSTAGNFRESGRGMTAIWQRLRTRGYPHDLEIGLGLAIATGPPPCL
jgi:hypothetical protein